MTQACMRCGVSNIKLKPFRFKVGGVLSSWIWNVSDDSLHIPIPACKKCKRKMNFIMKMFLFFINISPPVIILMIGGFIMLSVGGVGFELFLFFFPIWFIVAFYCVLTFYFSILWFKSKNSPKKYLRYDEATERLYIKPIGAVKWTPYKKWIEGSFV